MVKFKGRDNFAEILVIQFCICHRFFIRMRFSVYAKLDKISSLFINCFCSVWKRKRTEEWRWGKIFCLAKKKKKSTFSKSFQNLISVLYDQRIPLVDDTQQGFQHLLHSVAVFFFMAFLLQFYASLPKEEDFEIVMTWDDMKNEYNKQENWRSSWFTMDDARGRKGTSILMGFPKIEKPQLQFADLEDLNGFASIWEVALIFWESD